MGRSAMDLRHLPGRETVDMLDGLHLAVAVELRRGLRFPEQRVHVDALPIRTEDAGIARHHRPPRSEGIRAPKDSSAKGLPRPPPARPAAVTGVYT